MKLPYDKDHVNLSVFDVDKFKLKKNEVARIILIEEMVDCEYTHWVADKGYFICTGKMEILQEHGSDAEGCIFCKHASDGGAIGLARRKFVTQIVQYTTNTRGELLDPISIDVKPWIFGDDKYNDLALKKDVHGDLRKKDLVIKCTKEAYQTFQIEVADAIWLKDENLKTSVVKVFKDKKLQEIEKALGRRLDTEQMLKLVEDATASPTTRETTADAAKQEVIGSLPAGEQPKGETLDLDSDKELSALLSDL